MGARRPCGSQAPTPTVTGTRPTAGNSPRSSSTVRRSARSSRAGCSGRSGTSRADVLRRPDLDELKQLAAANAFEIAAGEEEQFQILAEAILSILDGLEARAPAEIPVLRASRDPGRPPEAGEDPHNAIVRWCSVKADADGVLAGKRIALKDSVAI